MTTPNAPTLRKQANQLEKEAMFAELRADYAAASAKRAQAKAMRATINAAPPPPPLKKRAHSGPTKDELHQWHKRGLTLRQLASGFTRSVNRQLHDEPDF